MIGYRKFTLGLAYLMGMLWLGVYGIAKGVDLIALGLYAAGVATGVAAVVWGNVQVAKLGADKS